MKDEKQLTDLLNVRLPIIQAPMAGGATTPELVAAVSNADGLGSLGAGVLSPDDMRRDIRAIKQLTNKPFAVNLFIPEAFLDNREAQEHMRDHFKHVCAELDLDMEFEAVTPPYRFPFKDQLAVIIDERVPVFSFTFGIPADEYIDQLKQHGIKIMGTATSLPEGRALQKAGVDVVVGQGVEAGGHRGTFLGEAEHALLGLQALIPQLTSQLDLPVIAAGGIGNVKTAKAAITLGAYGVQMGTAFLTTHESGVSDIYKQALLAERYDNTRLTKVFSGKLARGINNKFIELMYQYEGEILPFPIQNNLTKQIRAHALKLENKGFMSLWAGQNACLCESMSAENLIASIAQAF